MNRPHLGTGGQLEILDCTLGERTFGVSFALGEKLSIASQLDSLGVAYIESPSTEGDPMEGEYLRELGKALRHGASQTVLFVREKAVGPVPDHVNNVTLGASCSPSNLMLLSSKNQGLLEDNLKQVRERVSHFKKQGKSVFFNAEHFFEGFNEDTSYALSALESAVDAGASKLVLCDSKGGALPHETEKSTKFVDSHFSSRRDLVLGIHARNDCGLAVANTLAAVKAGARHVQGSVNGLGERAGNADLCVLLPILVLKLGYAALNTDAPKQNQLLGLKALSETVSTASGFSNPQQPFLGDRAFGHTEPSHIIQIERNPRAYEIVNPELVGNTRKLGVDDASSILSEMWQLGLYSKDREAVARKVLANLRQFETLGYKFDDAKASMHLLILEAMGSDIRPFRVSSWETSTLRSLDGSSEVTGTVQVRVGEGEREKTVSASAKGVGPINAIDLALRKALDSEFPELKTLKLVSYSLNIVDSLSGTAAAARARTEFIEEPIHGATNQSWATIAVSDDVLDASIRALVDGYRYKLIFGRKARRYVIPDWKVALSERYADRC